MNNLTSIAPRLAKLMLLLSSDQPGEVVAAAGAIGRALESVGATWHDLAAALTTAPAGSSPSGKAAADSSDDAMALSMVRAMLQRDDLPTKRRRFLADLLAGYQRWGRFTPKQREAIARSWQWTAEEEAA